MSRAVPFLRLAHLDNEQMKRYTQIGRAILGSKPSSSKMETPQIKPRPAYRSDGPHRMIMSVIVTFILTPSVGHAV